MKFVDRGRVSPTTHPTPPGDSPDQRGGRAYPIYAPLVVADPAAAASLRGQSGIADILKRFDTLTKAVVAIGAWAPQHSTVWDSLDDDERATYRSQGAYAEISGRLLRADGGEVPTPTSTTGSSPSPSPSSSLCRR